MTKIFKFSFTSITIFVIIILFLFIPIIVTANGSIDFSNSLGELPSGNNNKEFITSNSNKTFSWPTPGYTTITCGFGYRKAPTSGASTYHGAIDIGAPTNSKIIACFSGQIIYTGFYGANGFTIMLQNANTVAVYSHLSPDFIVKKDEYVLKNQVIGTVGPKNVYGVPNNKYKDSNRQSH